MTWLESHQRSEILATQGHEALRQGQQERAQKLFAEAAEAETLAFQTLGFDKPRTLGITAVSAAALYYKAGDLDHAEKFAHHASSKSLPNFAKSELRELLQAIWNEKAQTEAGLSFMPGQVLVSVRGGEVVTGGAPLDLIVSKVQAVQSIFYRTAEYLKDLPLRKKGPPPKEIQERCRPWIFQSVPGSYQFAVAIQKPAQHELFPTSDLEPEILTDTFLAILRAIGDNTIETLQAIIPRDDYRETFLKMTRNLAPTGKSFEEMELRSTTNGRMVVLSPSTRKLIADTLRPPPNDELEAPEDEISFHGNLRALDLDKDWLDIAIDGKTERIWGVAETVDDLIGPMVNHNVVVRVRRGKRSSKPASMFIDIEREE